MQRKSRKEPEALPRVEKYTVGGDDSAERYRVTIQYKSGHANTFVTNHLMVKRTVSDAGLTYGSPKALAWHDATPRPLFVGLLTDIESIWVEPIPAEVVAWEDASTRRELGSEDGVPTETRSD